MRRVLNPLLLLVPVLLVACEEPDAGDEIAGEPAPGAEAPAAADATAAEAEIQQVRDAWLRAAEAGDAATIASLYSEDAVMVGPDGERAEGPQAIQEALTLEGLTNIELNSAGTEVGSELASDLGTYTQTFRTPEGQEATVSGHYLVVLRRQPDGNWRIEQHMASAPEGMPQGGEM